MATTSHPSAAATPAPAGTPRARLSVREKVGYSLGDAASNLYFQTFILFLPIFYTDVFGISAAAMGTMLLVTRIFDAANDPLMGVIADRTTTRWGKFRPYIAGLAVPFAIAGVLTFTTPDLSPTGMLVYAYVTYIALMVLYTAVNVPYSALMGVITPNAMERTEVSSYRFVAAFVGQTIVNSTALALVVMLGRGDERLGWQMTMVAYGVIGVLLLFGTFALTRERVAPAGQRQGRISEDLRDLTRNVPWLLIAAATVFQLTYIVMRGSATPYFFRYFVQDQQLTLFGTTIDLGFVAFTSAFATIGGIATLIGAILTKFFVKRMEKKNTYALFLIGSALVTALFFFVNPENVLLIFALGIVSSYFFGSVSVLQWAIYTDTADYGEWKFGRRATALIMAASLFALKLGVTFGGAAVGLVLASYGFVAGGVAQPETAVTGVRLLMSVFPAVFGLLGGAIMLFYPVKDRMMVTIEEELLARRGAA
jgi:glycoside/pentoside/hexuronide:cation symporter, GPH family